MIPDMSTTDTMSKRIRFSRVTNWRAIWLLPILLCVAFGSLRAQFVPKPEVIAVTKVDVDSKSIQLRFIGDLPGFPGVSSIDVHRAPDVTDAEWDKQVQHLRDHVGKTVSIKIRAQAFGSRGPVLSLFRKSEIRLKEEK